MKICVISSHLGLHAPTRIIEEGEKRGHEMHLTTWEDLYIDISNSGFYFGDSMRPLDYFDAIIPRSDRYSLKISEQKKVTKNMNTLFRLVLEYALKNKIFFLNSSYFSSYQSLDKMAQQFFFAQNNLPGINSFYFSNLEKFRKKINAFPIVAKVAEGSTGTSVFKLNSPVEITSFIDDRNTEGDFFIFQKFHKITNDFRVLVVGGKVLGIMKRLPKNGEWRTNFSLGGDVVAEKNDPEMEKLSLEIAKKMGFDYVGIDILRDSGRLHIIETNSLPQFKGFEKAFPSVNVAEELIKLVEKKQQ